MPQEKKVTEEIVVSETREYNIDSRAPIYLTIKIGDAQVGGTAVSLDGNNIAEGVINNLMIGKTGDDLSNGILNCLTKVKQSNPATMRNSVTYTLTGGVAPKEYPFEGKFSQPGNTAIYQLTLILSK